MHFVRAAFAAGVLAASSAALAAPCAGFTDVQDTSPFCVNVEWVKNRGITLGCTSNTLYCPNDYVTRLQMAVFLYRLGAQNAFLNGGNAFATAAVVGTLDKQPLDIQVHGTRAMRYEPDDISPNVVGGSAVNIVTPGVRGATIAGGGSPEQIASSTASNQVMDDYGTVGGGYANRAGGGTSSLTTPNATVAGGGLNTASGSFSTVGGGGGNQATNQSTTVAGGSQNVASGAYSTVAGGYRNAATGTNSAVLGGESNLAEHRSSTVPGGEDNRAFGDYSFAAGTRAKAMHDRSFVWSGYRSADTVSIADGDFIVYAPSPGRIRLFAGNYGSGGCEVGTADVGGNLTCQGAIAATTFIPTSDRSQKEGIVPVSPPEVLERLVALPVAEWSYSSSPSVRHMGPMGQDFRAAFGLGATDTGIATVDADGVALAAIQGLNAKFEAERAAKDAEIAALRAELAAIRAMLAYRGPVVATQ